MSRLTLLNGRIHTLNPAQPRAEALVVEQNRVVFVGSNDAARARARSGSLTIDLEGRSVIPGLNDCHLHPLSYGRLLTSVNLTSPPNRTIGDLVNNVRQWVKKTRPGEWITGWGYDDTKLREHRHLTRDDLDRVAPDNPVYLVRACGHLGVANSVALELAGVDAETEAPRGGHIDRDGTGRPTGLLRETAQQLVRQHIPDLHHDDIVEIFRLVGDDMARRGITSIWDAGVGRNSGVISAYRQLQAAGDFPVRVNLAIGVDLLSELEALSFPPGFGDDWLRMTAVKLMLDGSVSGHTAALYEPFCDSDDKGLLYLPQDELNELVARVHRLGLQAAIHAIGDRAVDAALEAIAHAQQDTESGLPASAYDVGVRAPGGADVLLPDIAPAYLVSPRHRVEHCSLTSPERIARLRALGVIPVPQPIFIYGEGESYLEYLGAERAAQAYTLRSFWNEGIPVPLSTDAPATSWNDPLDPFLNMRMAVTRTTEAGNPLGEGETITMEQALRAYTVHSAFASFDETRKGSLREGQLADLVVLEHDPVGVERDEGAFDPQEVAMTIMDGEVVYQAGV